MGENAVIGKRASNNNLYTRPVVNDDDELKVELTSDGSEVSTANPLPITGDIGTVDDITNVTSVDTVDAVTEVANVTSVDTVDTITTVSAVTGITNTVTVAGEVVSNVHVSDAAVTTANPMYVDLPASRLIDNSIRVIGEHEGCVHLGIEFGVTDYDGNVDIGTSKEWLIIAPNSSNRIHFTAKLASSLNGLAQMYEDAETSDNGTALSVGNMDRNSNISSTLLAYKDPTVTSDGNLMDASVIGTDGTLRQGGGNVGGQREKGDTILKQGAKYLIRFTTLTDNARVSLRIGFCEEGLI